MPWGAGRPSAYSRLRRNLGDFVMLAQSALPMRTARTDTLRPVIWAQAVIDGRSLPSLTGREPHFDARDRCNDQRRRDADRFVDRMAYWVPVDDLGEAVIHRY
jgi:hypothetical protein